MKGWLTIGLALIGGYVVLQWFLGQRAAAGSAVVSGELSGTQNLAGTQTAQKTGVGDFFVSPIASGVPAFYNAAIENGHGDLVAAAYHVNTQSTIPGSSVYEPAFGPLQNQDPQNMMLIG
jgi:hypothetical protein